LKGKAWVDLLGTLIFLFPFCVLMLWVSWPAVMNSWEVLEMSPDPGGLPRYPIKTAIPVAFLLVLIQGVSMTIRSLAVLMGVTDELGLEGRRGAGIAQIQIEEGS